MADPNKRAIIFGSTGLTGSFLLKYALEGNKYAEVICFNRRDIPASHPRQRNIISNFNDLDIYGDLFTGADIFCCLGTTFKQVQNDREAYYRSDVGIPLAAAKVAAERGASCYAVQTAMGADAGSSIFYNRLKGELEDGLSAMSLPALYIFRPSLLTGPRKEKRAGEKIGKILMQVLNPLLLGSLKKYRSIEAADVAKAMLNIAAKGEPGKHVYLSDAIQRIADAR